MTDTFQWAELWRLRRVHGLCRRGGGCDAGHTDVLFVTVVFVATVALINRLLLQRSRFHESEKYSEKCVWLHNSLLNNFQCCWQVLQTSTDLKQQFSAPFKAGNSRQVQTCYKPTVQETKKTATFSSLLQCGRNRSFVDLEPLRVDTTMLAALRAQAFSLGNAKLLLFISTEWNTAVITKGLF